MITSAFSAKVTPLCGRDFLDGLKYLLSSTTEFLIFRQYQMNLGSIYPLLKASGVWDLLVKKIGDGVKVRFILNTRFPSASQLGAQNNTIDLLKKAGIEVKERLPGRTFHEKLIISDGKRMILGSHNLTLSALSQNSEFSVLIEQI
jgi:phosphatidylserine/phosphatidylglycerophosphate/cardiolipin synthase-like enzyme